MPRFNYPTNTLINYTLSLEVCGWNIFSGRVGSGSFNFFRPQIFEYPKFSGSSGTRIFSGTRTPFGTLISLDTRMPSTTRTPLGAGISSDI